MSPGKATRLTAMTLTEPKRCPLPIYFGFAPVTRGWRGGTRLLRIYQVLIPAGSVAAVNLVAGAPREQIWGWLVLLRNKQTPSEPADRAVPYLCPGMLLLWDIATVCDTNSALREHKS